jgi:hypothetical protein
VNRELSTWENLNLKVNIVSDNESLENLKNKIKNYKKIFFDTETTSLNIYEASLV